MHVPDEIVRHDWIGAGWRTDLFGWLAVLKNWKKTFQLGQMESKNFEKFQQIGNINKEGISS